MTWVSGGTGSVVGVSTRIGTGRVCRGRSCAASLCGGASGGRGCISGGGGDDIIYGGDGNDVLFGDKGDILTGGAGKDDFGVYHVTGDDPVTITDYHLADDKLTIFHDGTSDLPTSVFDVSGGAMLHLDGEPVALLAGVKAADVEIGKVTQIY